jgi:uncharacterized membrane protein (TIGR02234 family)
MRSLSRVQLLAFIGVAIVLFVSTRPWATAELTAADSPALRLSFQLDAIPSACAAAVAVLFAVAGMVRNIVRRIFGIIAVVCGVAAGVISISTINPQGLVNEAIADSLGSYVESLQHANAYWPWLSAFGGVLMALAGVPLLIVKFPERQRTAKYDREPNVSQLSAWQSLDHGIDPTDSQTSPLD